MASILEIILRGKDAGASAAVKGLDKALGGLRTVLGGLGLGLGAAELVQFAQASIAAARESAAAEGELQAALTSSGQATEEYKAQLEGLATALENSSLFTDEQVMQAEASLVTFKNLGQDIMPQVVATVVDMGQKMGNLGSAAQLAGIALNAPEQAAARLQRQGILLSEAQKEQIATMVKLGNTAGAQGVILDAFNEKFGGQAQAARDAAGGAQDYAVAMGRLQEEMGGLLLTIGDAGATDKAVGWIDRLAAGASAWTSVIENMRLLSDANKKLTEELSLVEQAQQGAIGQVDRSGNAYKLAGDALGSLIGWFVKGSTAQEGFAEAVQEVTAAAKSAPGAIDAMTAASNRAAQAGYQAMRGMMAQAQATRDVASAAQEVNQGQLDLLAAKEAGPELGARITENRAAVFKMAQEKEEAEQNASERAAKQMASSFQQAADEIGNVISSKLTTTFQEVFKLPEGSADEVDEPARRLATVAAAGFGSEWLAQLGQQFSGQAFWQPMAAAIAAGDEGQLKAAATGALTQFSQGLIPQLWDVEVIKGQVRAQIQQGRIKEQLIETVKQELGAEGVTAAVGVVEAAAGNVGVATAQTEASVNTMAATATTAGEQIKGAFSGPIGEIDTLILRIEQLNKMLERTKVLAGEAGSAIGGLNPPNAAGGNGNLDGQAAMGPPAKW